MELLGMGRTKPATLSALVPLFTLKPSFVVSYLISIPSVKLVCLPVGETFRVLLSHFVPLFISLPRMCLGNKFNFIFFLRFLRSLSAQMESDLNYMQMAAETLCIWFSP